MYKLPKSWLWLRSGIKEITMKRAVLLLLCLAAMASGAFAMDKAVGGGIMFNYSRTIGKMDLTWMGEPNYDWDLARNGFGGFAFFGLGRYVELNLGFLYKKPGTIKESYTEYGVKYEGEEEGSDFLDGSVALQFGAYFKYPFVLSDRFVLFPTVGIDYEFTLNKGDVSSTGWVWWDDLWFRGGVGLDIFFSERLFLRTHFIYGVAVPIAVDKDFKDYFGPGPKFSHGLLVKAGLGFMF